MARRTPLHARHVAAGARMVEFAGFEMPLLYSGIREEHTAVREGSAIFDLSHMGEIHIAGPAAEPVVQRLLAGDVRQIRPGQAQYAVMCNERGGIIDDVVVYRGEDDFMIVVNAGCREKDVAWMSRHLGGGAQLSDRGDSTALIAIQGPRARAVAQPLTTSDLERLQPFHFVDDEIGGVPARISRTGYTGEDGLELFTEATASEALWDTLLDAGRTVGLRPAGLGARDTLRLEAGLRLYGQDMDEGVDPLSCGLGWTVRRRSGFIGDSALAAIGSSGPARRFTGLSLSGRAIARHGSPVHAGGRRAGTVTSGGFSFTLGHSIATAYLTPGAAEVSVEIRGMEVPAQVTPLPFYRRPRGGR